MEGGGHGGGQSKHRAVVHPDSAGAGENAARGLDRPLRGSDILWAGISAKGLAKFDPKLIDCHILDASFHSKDTVPILAANYVMVHVSMGDEGDKNLDIAKKYDTPMDKGVPVLAVLDPDGTVVYSQKQGEF
jgi:hypothetical protein